MRKAAAFILIFALMSGLCACGGGSGPSAEAPERLGEGGVYALKRLELPGSAMQLASDGERAYVLTSGYHLYALTGGEAVELDFDLSERLPCRMAMDGAGLKLVTCDEGGLSFSGLTALAELGDGFALINADVLYLLEPADAGDIPARRELSVYCLDPGMDDFLDLILSELNLTEPNIFARTLHDGETDGQARLGALSALLASGKGPDLVCFGGLDPSAYTGSGWFLDIYGLIDADPGFDRDELVAAAAYETDAGLFSIPTAFGISTLLGRESRFEGRYALDAAVSGELEAGQILCRYGLESLIASPLAAQLSKGELPEQEQLTALLELSAASANRAEYLPPSESLGKDRVLLEYQYLYSANTFAECEAAAGCGLWPAGVPTFDGSCGSLASSLICWGACTDGGWELLKALLRLPEANLFRETFMYRPLFEQQLEQSKADERQREIFRGLVESLRLADHSSSELRAIIQEELSAGAPPEQAARAILDRASLLIAERG